MSTFLKLFLAAICLVSSSMSLPQRSGSPKTSECLVKEASSGQLKPCAFPFTYSRRVYTECTTFSDPQKKHWCSTKVDEKGVHVGKIEAWGYCDMSNHACSGKAPPPPGNSGISTVDSSDDSKGTWKPSAERGECGVHYPGGFLVGGEVALPGEFPYMALLGYEGDDGKTNYLCGGALINRYYVITAAHCHSEKSPIRNVVLGENVVGKNPDCTPKGCLPKVQDIEVESVKVHEAWDKNRIDAGNDIALIRLAKPAGFFFDEGPGIVGQKESSVSPICLPWDSTLPGFDLSKVSNATVTGWGRITNNVSEANDAFRQTRVSTENLMKASLPISNPDDCKPLGQGFSSSRQICAGGKTGVDSCNGDSGGPLAYKIGDTEAPWYLIGIVSYGTRKCGVGIPGVYTKVTNYLDWIERNLKA